MIYLTNVAVTSKAHTSKLTAPFAINPSAKYLSKLKLSVTENRSSYYKTTFVKGFTTRLY